VDNFFYLLEKYLMGPMGKLAKLKYVRVLMNAGLATVPFTIVGSIFIILNNISQTFPALKPFFEATFFKYSAIYSIGTTMSLGAIAIFYSLAIGYYLTDLYKIESKLNMNSFNGAILAIFAFLMTIVQTIFVDGSAQTITTIATKGSIVSGIAVSGGIVRFGGIGIFVAIVTGLLAVEIYRFCVVKNLTIKMPEGVPEGVSRAFASLVPAILIAFTMIFINIIFSTLGTDIHQVLGKPFGFVQNFVDSWLGAVIIMLLIHLLWSVGIHGTSIIKNSFVNPILLVALTENMDGGNNILAGDFINMYIFLGGAGTTLSLVLLMQFYAKSDQLKMLAKASIIPGLFNINEPVVFGAPIVYNPYLVIPYIIVPIVNISIAYWAVKLQLVSKVIAAIPWTSPIGIGAFLGTGGDFRAVLLSFTCLIISGFIYFPFFRIYDNNLYEEQTKGK